MERTFSDRIEAEIDSPSAEETARLEGWISHGAVSECERVPRPQMGTEATVPKLTVITRQGAQHPAWALGQ